MAFNEFNVTVQCHACGAEEADVDMRQKHHEEYIERYINERFSAVYE